MANTIVPWSDILVTVSNCLNALDKWPGVQPISIGESLQRIVGTAVCSATHADLAVHCGTNHVVVSNLGLRVLFMLTDLFEEHRDWLSSWGFY